jgi:asparagine synthase (glutamine-hydrolysing)
MCGIWAYFNGCGNMSSEELYKEFMLLKHRGPDHSTFQQFGNTHYIGFHRLSIMDPTPISNQPYVMEMPSGEVIIFICNGEIYNYRELSETYKLDIHGNSDCMTIPSLYKLFEHDYQTFTSLFAKQIKGEFSFVMSVFKNNILRCVICGRDQIGIRPLYYGMHSSVNNPDHTTLLVSSEIKSCNFFIGEMHEFEPGTIQRFFVENDDIVFIDMFRFSWCYNVVALPLLKNEVDYNTHLNSINSTLTECISRRLTADVPIGFLLSGGVDSSLVCAISSKIMKDLPYKGNKIRTFCCGMEGGTDFDYARKVAEYIGSDHTEVVFTLEEALASINSVIYTTETWDTTTIRASVGQYLISSYIRQSTDIKVLLVGEGPDEVCSSYLFNWYAPSPEELHYAAIDYVSNIHKYDVRRVDRCSAMWGLEARVPYLDPEFIETYWNIPATLRDPKTHNMEKYMLREAFKTDVLLPEDVLWRRKEAFSDGISSQKRSWFQSIQEHIYKTYNMSEEEYYKDVFIKLFGNRQNILDKYWQPKWDSSGNVLTNYVDPSARTLEVYAKEEEL